jgi:hypothetical protein
MTLDSVILTLSWAMSEALQGAVLLLGALTLISTLYLLLGHLARTIRNRLDGDRGAGGA